MNISARCEYACRAMVELALMQQNHDPVASSVLAERRHIPEKYLVHILLQLKRAGLVQSVRGAQGGYRLGRLPEDITLLEVVQAIDGPVLDPLPVNDGQSLDLRAVWKETADSIAGELRQISIREVADRAAASPMYYI
ncbi:MAG: Rrf2 family transcriptional regulator [Candidatus Hydrogenedentes bacterium]|nr:Rrf2 family transcriptional regulator [Candidatus Hydrogenedentota bacterium]